MPAGRNAEPVRGPYATRTPTAVIMTSPPTPGRATAASAHIEARRNSQARWKYDCSPIGTSCGASGAIPDSNDSPPSAITSSDATPVAALPAVGAPGVPARGRTSGTCDAPDTPAAIPNPSPSMPPNPSTTGATPAVLNKKEERSNGSCVSGTTAPATSGTGATASITGATASVTGATASVTGATRLGTAATGLGALGTRTASSFWSSVSVPPAPVVGLVGPGEGWRPEPNVLVGPVEGWWPVCPPEPTVPVTSRTVSRTVSVTSPTALFRVGLPCDGELPSFPFGPEPKGSATATVPPPNNRPAAMTKTPAAKRKCGVPTIPPYFLKASSALLSPVTVPTLSYALPPRSWALFFALSAPLIVSAPTSRDPPDVAHDWTSVVYLASWLSKRQSSPGWAARRQMREAKEVAPRQV
jgi:hypothetical protein